MTIVCGTDFSVPSLGALRAAAAIAARRGEPLRLVHVQSHLMDPLSGEARGPLVDLERTLLHDAAAKARELGAEVTEEMVLGDPASQLIAVADRVAATLIVVAWVGRRTPTRWFVGSVAERVSRESATPVLVVRDADPLVAWARGEAPLGVTVADDLGEGAACAVRWTAGLDAIGPTLVSVVHVAWPPELHEKLGERASEDLERLRPAVQAKLREEVRARASELGLSPSAAIEVEQGFGRPDNHVAILAERIGSDLLVVGSHQRAGLDRLWHGSVSRGLLHLANQNIASIPPRSREQARPTPAYRAIVVATDFSEIGDAAIPHAFAIAPPGATVHLMHVVPTLEGRSPLSDRLTSPGSAGGVETTGAEDAQIVVKLARLVPKDAAARGIEAACHVVHGGIPEEIIAMGSRLGADVLCLGSRARSGIAAALLGSVARAVVARASLPVLIVGRPEG